MQQMKEPEIIRFLKDNVEPLQHTFYGAGYRASVYLLDGTFLPCVVFYNTKARVELAKKRIEEERSGTEHSYSELLRVIVASGNRISNYQIGKVEASRFAIPISILKQIQSETRMGWTGFVCKMKDGKYFSFGTSFNFEFFSLPDNYSFDDIDEIINHSYVLKTGEVMSCHTPMVADKSNIDLVYTERPFFECYLENLD